MSAAKRLTDLDFNGKRVLLRAGFDVPIEHGTVTDTARIDALKETMLTILDKGSLVILAHQGRPKGKPVQGESQKPLVPVLEKILGRPVQFAPSCIGSETEAMANALKVGEVLLLENLRYDAREEANDPAFAAELARLGDVYVCDAFSNAHRAHASMVGVPALLPSAMGLQMEKEIDALTRVLKKTDGLCMIVCGAKLETKVPVIEHFLEAAQSIVVCGAIANTFLAAAGKNIGVSLSDPKEVPLAQSILKRAGKKLFIPTDVVAAPSPAQASSSRTVSVDDVAPDDAIFDVGPQSVKQIASIIDRSKTVVWNGPLGYAEEERFAQGSIAIAAALATATTAGVFTVVGGGDTLELHARYNLPLSAYSFVSTGGGAMLDFLSGQELPALAALRSA